MTPLVAVVLLFLVVGIGFIFVHLVLGKLIRPNKPGAEKKTIYECGEPTIGSAWIQFDLRFYVVALLFVVFDVEVAFFFPWAEVFGKANNIAAAPQPTTEEEWRAYGQQVAGLIPPHDAAQVQKYSDLKGLDEAEFQRNRANASGLGWLAFLELAVFFGVLLVGFAYLWRRGDLAWVRSTLAERPAEKAAPATRPAGQQTQPLTGAGAGS
jgi:NADH-quinone oxidoreductase subunit A